MRPLLRALPVTLIFALFLRTFLLQGYRVASASMEKSLLPGDYILVNKMIYASPPPSKLLRLLVPVRAPRRADIIRFQHPLDPATIAIKRIVGLPGEQVAATVEAPSGERKATRSSSSAPRLLAAEHYWVLGDNRAASHDSRSWGPIHRRLIKARPLLIYWSVTPGSGFGGGQRKKTMFSAVRWERLLQLVR